MKKIVVSREVSQKTPNKHYSEFQYWFAGCLQYCTNHPNKLWDDYVWNLKTSGAWKKLYLTGVSEELAVKQYFKFNESLN